MRKKYVYRFILIATLIIGLILIIYPQIASPEPKVTFIPVETDDVLSNPYMGFSVSARNLDTQQPVRLTHANIRWSEIEPIEGMYSFEEFEDSIHLDEWRKRKVTVVLRVILDYPGSERHLDIPGWLYEKIGKLGTWYDLDYGQGFSPNYNDPELIRAHERLILALAERYDNDPSIAFIQLGSIGHWGEWHTWDEGEERIPYPTRDITDQYVRPYLKYFKNKPLLMRRPHVIAKENGMGLFNDAFGKRDATIEGFHRWFNEGYTSWLTGEEEPAMPEFWVTAPSGGEFADETAYVKDDRIDETIRQAKLTHISWLGPQAPVNEPIGGPLQANIDRLLRTIGYRFVIAKVTHEQQLDPGDRLHIEMLLLNRGVAPYYWEWPFELSLWDTEGARVASILPEWDIRELLPGDRIENAVLDLPTGLLPGEYTLAVAVLDPATREPGIRFAIEGERPDIRYAVSSLTIRE